MSPTQLPAQYLNLLRNAGLGDEAYKWELLRKQKGHPDPTAADFIAEVENLDFDNLVFYNSANQLVEYAKAAPEVLRKAFAALLASDPTELVSALSDYRAATDKILAETRPGTDLNNFQDERTAATLLFFSDPTRYTLYKASIYRKFCDLLGEPRRSAGEKYNHYLDMLRGYVAEHILPNKEINDIYLALVPEADELDPNRLLLAQDMLFRVLERKEGVSDVIEDRDHWFVGASLDGSDMTDTFVKEGQWRSGYSAEQLPALTKIQVGDPIAIKSSFVRKRGLPFDNEDQLSVSTMRIKAIGKVTKRIDEQNLAVSWQTNFTPKDWYFYTYQGTLWRVTPDDWKGKALLGFTFHDEVQDYDKFMNDPYWRGRFGEEVFEVELEVEEALGIHPLNQVLYGPPGTGKTYATRQIAVEICEGRSFAETPRDEVQIRYIKLVAEGRIAFTTFHPSLSYEDFVEGIKPETTVNGQVTYKVEFGIFLRLAQRARRAGALTRNTIQEFEKADVDFDDVYEEFVAAVKRQDPDIRFLLRKGKEMTVERISHRGDITLLSPDGDHPQPTYRTQLRTLDEALPSVELIRDITKEIRSLGVGGHATAFYAVLDAFRQFRERKDLTLAAESTPAPHVLIIDEINRGNTAAIFGELITLLEEDKRLGNREALTVTLPYSKTAFGVPANLHVIGTMNTADRSVEALDAALRRRFAFVEIAPDPQVLAKAGKSGKKGGVIDLDDGASLNLVEFLRTINSRIVALRDRDHAIGHAAFLEIDSPETLRQVLAKAVLPLLREYFYGDDAQLAMVLGHGFVPKVETSVTFPEGTNDDGLVELATRFKIEDVMHDFFDLGEALRAGGFLSGDAS